MGTAILVVVLVVVIAAAGFAVALARKGKRQFEAQAAGPGLADGAPREWAGAHSPEAKLHRRLAAAARTLSAQPLGDAAAIERRVTVQQQILELDQHLVAVAAVPNANTAHSVAGLEPRVTSVEQAVAQLATPSLEPLGQPELDNPDAST